MKSIIHEASSIGKAIEQGWQKAGCPKEFSVRILEEPERNFIGLTIKTAKVALFFGEKTQQPTPSPAPRRREIIQANRPARQESNQQPSTSSRNLSPRSVKAHDTRPERHERPERLEQRERTADRGERPSERHESTPHEIRERQSFWTDEHASFAREWISGALSALGKQGTPFVVETKGYHLHIALSERLMTDASQEKHLFANCAFLLGEALKRQFRTSLRGHKIVLTHGRSF
jgi:hypothetical protein